MKFFRLLTAFSASFFLPSSAGDFSLFSLCRLLNLPQSQRGGGSAPPTPGDFAKLLAPATHYAGAPREHGKAMLGTRVTFPSRGKSPKARQGLRPLESPEGDASLPLRFPHPLDRVSATKIDRFATLGWWANRSCFFLWFHRGNTLCFQSVARQIPYPRGCREPFYPQPIPLGQKARGSKGARPPSPGVQGPGGPWRIFAYFLYARK